MTTFIARANSASNFKPFSYFNNRGRGTNSKKSFKMIFNRLKAILPFKEVNAQKNVQLLCSTKFIKEFNVNSIQIGKSKWHKQMI